MTHKLNGFMFSGDNLTFVLDGQTHSMLVADKKFEQAKKHIKAKNYDALYDLVNDVPNITESLDNQTFNGQVVDPVIVQHIKKLQENGLPNDGMLKFLEKLYKNTSYRVRNQLFEFMKNKHGFAVSDDGYLLAYKAVKDDWTDKHTGTISHKVGSVIEMDRGLVNDNPDDPCGAGLHAGSLNFISGFGCSGDHIVIVKIDPADVVSIPKDHSYEKIRCCKYEVVAEYHKVLDKVVYTKEELDMPAEIDTTHKWNDIEDDDSDIYDDDSDVYNDEDDSCIEDDDSEIYEDDSDVDDSDYEDKEDDSEIQSDEEMYSCYNYGIKPSGHKFYNKRNKSGKFSK